jgi:hypothetical protein
VNHLSLEWSPSWKGHGTTTHEGLTVSQMKVGWGCFTLDPIASGSMVIKTGDIEGPTVYQGLMRKREGPAASGRFCSDYAEGGRLKLTICCLRDPVLARKIDICNQNFELRRISAPKYLLKSELRVSKACCDLRVNWHARSLPLEGTPNLEDRTTRKHVIGVSVNDSLARLQPNSVHNPLIEAALRDFDLAKCACLTRLRGAAFVATIYDQVIYPKGLIAVIFDPNEITADIGAVRGGFYAKGSRSRRGTIWNGRVCSHFS